MYSLMLHSNAEHFFFPNILPKVIRIELILRTLQHQMIYLPQQFASVKHFTRICMHALCTY